MRANDIPSTSAASVGVGRGSTARPPGPRSTVTTKKHTVSPGPGSSPVARWTAWRVWNEGIYNSLEEHFASGNYLHSRLSLSKLFLDKLSIWDTDYRFHHPKTPNFMQVFVTRVTKIQREEVSDELWIKAVEVACAETAEDKKQARHIVEICGELGRVVRDIVEKGDFLVIWGGAENINPEFDAERKVLILNDEEGTEPSYVAVYRHNGEFCYPMTPRGYIPNTLTDGNVRDVYCRGIQNENTDIVYVQKILPSSKSQKKWIRVAVETEAKETAPPPPVRRDPPTSPRTQTRQASSTGHGRDGPPPPPLFTSTPMGPPRSPSSSKGNQSTAVPSPTKRSSPRLKSQQGTSAVKPPQNPVVVVDDDDGTEVDRNAEVVVVKNSSTKIKKEAPSGPPPPRPRRAKNYGLKLVSTGENNSDYEEVDDEEDYVDAQENLEEEEIDDGDSDKEVPMVDIADDSGEETTPTSPSTFMTPPLLQPSPPPPPPESNVPQLPDIGAEVDVSTTSSVSTAGTELLQSVRDVMSDIVDAVAGTEGQREAGHDQVTLEEFFGVHSVRRVSENTATPPAPILNESPGSASGRAEEDRNLRISQSAVAINGTIDPVQLWNPIPPADESQQQGDLNDPIWTQMVEMHYGQSQSQGIEMPATPFESPIPEKSQRVKRGEKRGTGTMTSPSPTATSTTKSSPAPSASQVQARAGSGSRRNLFSQEVRGAERQMSQAQGNLFSQQVDGAFTQMVTGIAQSDGTRGSGEDVDDSSGTEQRKRPQTLVSYDEESTDEMSEGRSRSQAEGRLVKRKQAAAGGGSGSRSPPSQPPAKRLRACRAGMSKETQGGGRKPIFPQATYVRIHRKKESGTGTTSYDSASDGARDPAKKKKRHGSPTAIPEPEVQEVSRTPPRASRSTAPAAAGSRRPSTPRTTPVKLTAKLRSRTTTPKKSASSGASSSSSPAKRVLARRKK